MRVLVTASRKHTPETMWTLLFDALHDVHAPPGKGLTIIHGAAKGGDDVASKMAEQWGANEYRFPAEWEHYGRKYAGPFRNAEMLQTMAPDVVLAFPLPDSKGTWQCVTEAHKRGYHVEVYP